MKNLSNKLIVCLLLTVLLLSLSACGSDSTAKTATPDAVAAGYRQITAEEAAKIMETETGYIILDVRRQDEYDTGHIPGAICVPNERIGDAEIPELPDKDQLILVYCRSGRRSKEASQKLVDLGYTDIVEFGGIIDWTGEVVTE